MRQNTNLHTKNIRKPQNEAVLRGSNLHVNWTRSKTIATITSYALIDALGTKGSLLLRKSLTLKHAERKKEQRPRPAISAAQSAATTRLRHQQSCLAGCPAPLPLARPLRHFCFCKRNNSGHLAQPSPGPPLFAVGKKMFACQRMRGKGCVIIYVCLLAALPGYAFSFYEPNTDEFYHKLKSFETEVQGVRRALHQTSRMIKNIDVADRFDLRFLEEKETHCLVEPL
jgi:hypothetical protein